MLHHFCKGSCSQRAEAVWELDRRSRVVVPVISLLLRLLLACDAGVHSRPHRHRLLVSHDQHLQGPQRLRWERPVRSSIRMCRLDVLRQVCSHQKVLERDHVRPQNVHTGLHGVVHFVLRRQLVVHHERVLRVILHNKPVVEEQLLVALVPVINEHLLVLPQANRRRGHQRHVLRRLVGALGLLQGPSCVRARGVVAKLQAGHESNNHLLRQLLVSVQRVALRHLWVCGVDVGNELGARPVDGVRPCKVRQRRLPCKLCRLPQSLRRRLDALEYVHELLLLGAGGVG
mmetsp:Transcript_16283/g.31282  ORF Transcript_16283/g.31282 Transcript_16283/m.31282 type:complete len:287 (-) Transcript_16283:213-1073(-)